METDEYLDGSVASGLRHQHHDHDSDGECSVDSQMRRRRNEGVRANNALRRPVKIVRASSDSSGSALQDGRDIGFHQGQQTRHRSPLSNYKINLLNRNGNANRRLQSSKSHKKGANSRGSHTRPGRRIRALFTFGGVGYLLLMIYLLSQLRTTPFEPGSPPSESQIPTRPQRESDDRTRANSKIKARNLASERALRRRERTRPPDTRDIVPSGGASRYEFILMDDQRRTQPNQFSGELTRARMQDLCGDHARNASLANPDSFLASDALNSKSRVMITGVLNMVGYHLALVLKERCGVEVVMGIDLMYPNTVKNRLELLERMEVLATNIPKLVQPIAMPVVGLDPRLNKKRPANSKQPALLRSTGELNLRSFQPTHIVHIASFRADEYMDVEAAKDERLNMDSPYVSNNEYRPLYQMRSSMVSMEHVLASISAGDKETMPHFTYASSMGVTGKVTGFDKLHCRIKLVDEILAGFYKETEGVFSVGLRFPSSVYGQWGRKGTLEYDLAEAVIYHPSGEVDHNELLKSVNVTEDIHEEKDFVYVHDMADAIIASMQYRPHGGASAIFNAGSESMASIGSVAQIMSSLHGSSNVDMKIQTTKSAELSSLVQPIKDALHWSASTNLWDGMVKVLAWHLDRSAPFGHPKSKASAVPTVKETGDEFRRRHDTDTCQANDLVCNSGSPVLPCISECSSKSSCTSSIFDEVSGLMLEVTEGCDIVLYTQSLGHDVEDLSLEAQYMEEGKNIVCNFAFLPQSSKIVKRVTKKVPESQLKKFGISLKGNSDEKMKRKIEGLNGRLLYKGWILIWVQDDLRPLAPADDAFLKLSPGKLFANCVTHAMFVAENFPVTPNSQDVLFLADETRRPHWKEHFVYRKEQDGKKHKYWLEAEPERRAVMLAAPLKQVHVHGQHGNKDSITVKDATKFMMHENGDDPFAHEPVSIRKQREFYERFVSYCHRVDLRSPLEPLYKFVLKRYIRTRWIVHDMRREEARQLRCEWYQEHIRWGNDIDQLSFAFIMEMRETKRRILNKEPDDRMKSPLEEHPELKELSDSHEWHAIVGEQFIQGAKEITSKETKGKPQTLYVRIMSEHFMLLARKAWAQKHKRKIKKR